MKFSFCVLVISLFVGQIYCGEEVKQHMEECKKEQGMEEGKEMDVNDPKTKCMWACVMEKIEVMVDEKLDTEKYIEKIKMVYADADDEFVKGCAEKGNSESDKCEVVGAAYKCVKDKYGPPKNVPDLESKA